LPALKQSQNALHSAVFDFGIGAAFVNFAASVLLSALGHEQTCAVQKVMSALALKADTPSRFA
jgi:hypothetical protein